VFSLCNLKNKNNNSSFQNNVLNLSTIYFKCGPIAIEYIAHIQDETNDIQPFCVLAIHDLGCDCMNLNIYSIEKLNKKLTFYKDSHFDSFICCEQMSQFKDKIKWLRVDMPGQPKNSRNLIVK
jgi:hypothetical protein